MEPYRRTAREFVEDLITDGRTARQILAVAQSTRWNQCIEEVKEIVTEFSKMLKKSFQV